MDNLVWLIQTSGINFTNLNAFFYALTENNYQFNDFGLIKNSNEITNLENILNPNDLYIIRGGTKLLTVFNSINSLSEINNNLSDEQINQSTTYLEKLKNGIFYDVTTFDQKYYQQFDLPLLNQEAKYIPIKDNLNLSYPFDVFIKPSRDLKAFNAGILKANTTIIDYIKHQPHQKFFIDEYALISKLKAIDAEYRFFVINQEIISYSQYKQFDEVYLSNKIDSKIFSHAKAYAKLYQPHDIFTMDLALSDNKIKIIEYNCFNASGLYLADAKPLIKSVSDYQINKYSKNIKFSKPQH